MNRSLQLKVSIVVGLVVVSLVWIAVYIRLYHPAYQDLYPSPQCQSGDKVHWSEGDLDFDLSNEQVLGSCISSRTGAFTGEHRLYDKDTAQLLVVVDENKEHTTYYRMGSSLRYGVKPSDCGGVEVVRDTGWVFKFLNPCNYIPISKDPFHPNESGL